MELQSPKTEEEEKRRRKRKWPMMKAAQLLEFQMQALVYRYIEAGLRVPHHLVVPIWNSLALSSSSSSCNDLINQQNHSLSLLSDKGLNHIDTVEPEPARCRRTDGKKWRCSNRVLPFQKYCERHMHRGRKRSRKLVESSFEFASSSTKHDNTYGLDKSQGVFHETMSVSSNAQVVTIASLPSARACDNVTHSPLVISCVQKFFPEESDISVEAATFSSIRKNDIIERSRVWKNMYLNGGLFPGIHFSPDTVLQDRGGISSDNELENAGFSPFTMKTAARSVTCKDEDGQKHSVSVLGMPQPRVSDEKSTSSYSTDTTITDSALGAEEDNQEEFSLSSSGV